jgi:hypothetical protein
MPISSHNDTPTISIVGIVTERSHFLCLARLIDVIALHTALHFHTLEHKPTPFFHGRESFGALDAIRIPVAIPVAV